MAERDRATERAGAPGQRRRAAWAAGAAVLAALGWACADDGATYGSPGAAGRTQQSQPAEGAKEKAMSDIVVAVTVLKTDAIAGETFPVRIALMNHGGFPVAVHSGLGSSPFMFQVLGESGVLMTLSDEEARGRTQPDRAPPPKPEMHTLARGGGKIYEQDALRAALEPLAPGSYRLVAIYRFGDARWESDPVPFTLRAPAVSAFAAIGSPASATLAWALTDSPPGAAAVIFARESRTGVGPAGVAYRIASLPAGSPPSSAAVAEELGPWQSARWCAWVRDGLMAACLSAGEEAFATVEPFPIGLDNPALLPAGRQQDTKRGSFLVAGTTGGNARLKEFTLQRSQAPAIREVTLPAVPDRRSAVCFEPGSDGVTTHILLCVRGKTDALVARTFRQNDSGEGGTTRTLLESTERIVAVYAPVRGDGGTAVAVLAAPEDAKTLRLFTVPLAGGESRPSDLPMPRLAPGETVKEWAVGPASDGAAPGLLVTSRRVLALAPGAPGWSEVDIDDGARGPQIVSVQDSLCALWLSKGRGVVYHEMAPASAPAEPEAATVEQRAD